MTDSNPTGSTDPRLLRLAPEDNVCVATAAIELGESIVIGGQAVTLEDGIPLGHKIAILPIATGQKIIKYGAPIGSAVRDIPLGRHVHTHNLASDYLPTYARGESTRQKPPE